MLGALVDKMYLLNIAINIVLVYRIQHYLKVCCKQFFFLLSRFDTDWKDDNATWHVDPFDEINMVHSSNNTTDVVEDVEK